MKPTQSDSYWHGNAKHFADFYSQGVNILSPERFVKQFLSKRTDTLFAYTPVSKKTVMLDLGCGSGEHIKEFIPKVKHIYGVDYSKQMIDIAKSELKKCPQKRYTLIQADAAHVPLKAKSVDVIIAMGLLDYVDSPDDVLRECKRLLKPNGILVYSMPKSPSIFSFLRTPFGIFLRKLLFHLPPIANTHTKEELETTAHRNRFAIEHTTPIWDAMWMVKSKRI